MDNREKLIKNYKGKVKPHEQSIDDLIISLAQRFDIKKLEVVSYQSPVLEIMQNQQIYRAMVDSACLDVNNCVWFALLSVFGLSSRLCLLEF